MKQLYGISTLASHWNLGGRQQAWLYWYLSNQLISTERHFSALMIPSLPRDFASVKQPVWVWMVWSVVIIVLSPHPSPKVIGKLSLWYGEWPTLLVCPGWGFCWNGGIFSFKSWDPYLGKLGRIVHLTFYLFSLYFLPLPTSRQH